MIKNIEKFAIGDNVIFVKPTNSLGRYGVILDMCKSTYGTYIQVVRNVSNTDRLVTDFIYHITGTELPFEHFN